MKRPLGVLALTVLFAACGSSAHKTQPPQSPVDWRGRTHVDVDARDDVFTPATIIVSPGTTVTWHNVGKSAHNVEKATDSLDFGAEFGVAAGAFDPGQRYSFTFEKAGVFPYTCTIHTLMNGQVQVDAGVPGTTAPKG